MGEIKSIQIQEPVDLENCDQEPIHIPGSIQPHGALLGLNEANLNITYCSGNTAGYFGLAPVALLGKSVDHILGNEGFEKFREYVRYWNPEIVNPLEIRINGIEFYISIHFSGATLICEFEPKAENKLQLDYFYNIVSNFVSHMKNAGKLTELCQHVVEETRRLTGYDRVMVYRFDRDYNGAIIAESKEEGLEPFLNLHYPHTDIPRQARELYLRNLMRMIGDVGYKPVPVFTLPELEQEEPLDMGLAHLRSVSPIHVEYLQNMGVGATLVVSLLCEGRLWGLLTCHHYSAKVASHQERTMAKLQGHFLSSQIAVRERAEEYDCEQKVNIYLNNLIDIIKEEEDFIKKIFEEDIKLIKLTNASGIALSYENRVLTAGTVPSEDKLQRLLEWMKLNMKGEYLSTDKLLSYYDEAEEVGDVAAGVVAFKAGKLDDFMLIWFRPEMEKTVNWAGDPAKAVVVKEDGSKRLTPRKSFEQWKQRVRYQSLPWRDCEVNAGIKLASNLYSQLIWRNLKEEERKYRLMSEKLQRANEDLEQFTWMSSHDMKEPLRMISIYSQMLLKQYSDLLDESGQRALNFINEGVRRLNTLTSSILQYSKLGQSDRQFEEISIRDVIDQVIKGLEVAVRESGARVEIYDMPEKIKAEPILIGQLFQNLLHNAIKFRDEGELVVKITAGKDKDEWVFCVADNGIGMDMKYSDRIFSIFQRLHTQSEYEGSGIGLSICKRIVELHNGRIWVESEMNKGTSFYFTLPAGN